MKTRRITLEDIAEACQVSSASVSLALSGKGKISEELRNKIHDKAIELGYINKKAMASSTGKTIAILMYMTHDWAYLQDFITPILTQLQMKLTKHGLFPMIIPITDMISNEEIKESIISSNAVSVISIHYANEIIFKEIMLRGLPLTVINNSSLQKQFYSVSVDDFQGAYDGAKHLIELNHKHILYMDYWRRNQPQVYLDRFIGFKKAIDEFQIPFVSSQRITFEIGDQLQIESGIVNTLRLHPRTTAIFAHDDRLAIRIYVELEKKGYKIPEDISIIAPGDTLDYSLPYIPQITTMKIDTNLLGSLSADIVIHRTLDNPDLSASIKVSQQLVKRGSCCKI